MNTLLWIVSVAISLAGAFALIKLSETAEYDWFGVPKLLVAVVFFVVFLVSAVFILATCNSRRKHIEEGDDPAKTPD